MLISILIYLCISFCLPKTNENTVKVRAKLVQVDSINNERKIEDDWYLEIPKIDLHAEILEGTDEETLNTSVAHFTETVKENGNIGLAAHNRGYKVNYFEKLKTLKKGDKIIYAYNREPKRI